MLLQESIHTNSILGLVGAIVLLIPPCATQLLSQRDILQSLSLHAKSVELELTQWHKVSQKNEVEFDFGLLRSLVQLSLGLLRKFPREHKPMDVSSFASLCILVLECHKVRNMFCQKIQLLFLITLYIGKQGEKNEYTGLCNYIRGFLLFYFSFIYLLSLSFFFLT